MEDHLLHISKHKTALLVYNKRNNEDNNMTRRHHSAQKPSDRRLVFGMLNRETIQTIENNALPSKEQHKTNQTNGESSNKDVMNLLNSSINNNQKIKGYDTETLAAKNKRPNYLIKSMLCDSTGSLKKITEEKYYNKKFTNYINPMLSYYDNTSLENHIGKSSFYQNNNQAQQMMMNNNNNHYLSFINYVDHNTIIQNRPKSPHNLDLSQMKYQKQTDLSSKRTNNQKSKGGLSNPDLLQFSKHLNNNRNNMKNNMGQLNNNNNRMMGNNVNPMVDQRNMSMNNNPIITHSHTYSHAHHSSMTQCPDMNINQMQSINVVSSQAITERILSLPGDYPNINRHQRNQSGYLQSPQIYNNPNINMNISNNTSTTSKGSSSKDFQYCTPSTVHMSPLTTPSNPKLKATKITSQNYSNLTNEELSKNAYIIAKYQSGCKFLQNKIEENPSIAIDLFYQEILEHLQELSTDQYGNFFVNQLLSHLSEERLMQFIAVLYPYLGSIGKNHFGSKVIQKLIDNLNTEQLQYCFINILFPHTLSFINDPSGNAGHIMLKVFTFSFPYTIDPIIEIIVTKIEEIVTDRKGCAIIQKCLQMLSENHMTLILDALEYNLINLIIDQYGNYTIQHIIEYVLTLPTQKQRKNRWFNIIIKYLVLLSNQKFSSNVIEKCFLNDQMAILIRNELENINIFQSLLFDIYGNYVVQKAISTAKGNQQLQMLSFLIILFPQLQLMPFGRKLINKMMMTYPILTQMINRQYGISC